MRTGHHHYPETLLAGMDTALAELIVLASSFLSQKKSPFLPPFLGSAHIVPLSLILLNIIGISFCAYLFRLIVLFFSKTFLYFGCQNPMWILTLRLFPRLIVPQHMLDILWVAVARPAHLLGHHF